MLLNQQQLETCKRATGQIIYEKEGHYWLEKDGKNYLLMPWRHNKRLNNMRQCVLDGSVHGISAMKSECVMQNCYPIFSLAAREIDVCEWLLQDQVEEVFALTDSQRVFHLIGRMKSGRRITVDISNALHENVRETERHEVIASHGSLCDLPVGMQLATEDIYAFRTDSEYPQTFSEVMLEKEFYTREEAAVIRDVRALMADEKMLAEREGRMDELMKIVYAAQQSAQKLERVGV